MTKDFKIKGVIFDFDGVIINTDVQHFLAWTNAFKKYNVVVDESTQKYLRGINRVDSAKKVAELYNLDFNEEKILKICEEKNALYLEYIKTITKKDILPGIVYFIDYLKSKNYKLAIASVSKNSITILKHIGLEKYFDVVIDPNNIRKGKPDPDIFFQAAKLLDIKPWECVAIEDAQAGIWAINSAMMQSICIDYHNEIKDCSLSLRNTRDLTPRQFNEFIKKIELYNN